MQISDPGLASRQAPPALEVEGTAELEDEAFSPEHAAQ